MILAAVSVPLLLGGLLTGCSGQAAPDQNGAATNTVKVVAAENFYGDIVKQLGGPSVSVSSIISDPNADPHEYESNTDNARAVASAGLVVENGLGYDSFVDKLLSASPNKNRTVINAGQLLGKKDGDNPHVWYDVAGVMQLADQITQALQQLEPSQSSDFAMRNQRFKASLQPVLDRMSQIKSSYGGTHLTQTEPVFGYMADVLGLQVDDGEFQHAVEEGTDPSPQAVAMITQELTGRQVKALLYNSQTTSPVTDNVKQIATQNRIPVVGVSETEPAKMTYQAWMLGQLNALQQALAG